ncbi:MAG: hypothetical protein Kow00122_16530 [Thermoleophilia bacterium]
MLDTTASWLRRSRRGFLGWAFAVGAMVTAVSAAFLAEAKTPADAARFGASLQAFALAAKPLFGEPVALDTAGGFLHWRILSLLPLVVGTYVILLVTGMTVREERRGSVDVVLSTPLGRARYMVERGMAVLAVCSSIGLLGLLLGIAGANLLGADLSLQAGLLAGLDLALILGVWGAAAALAGQLTLSRTAAGAAGGLFMVVTHLLANTAGIAKGWEAVARFLPTGAYHLSRPLVPGGSTDPAGLLTLAGEALLLWALATALFARRDLNVSRVNRAARRSERRNQTARGAGTLSANPLLRGPFARDAWALRGVTLGWAAGLAASLVFIVSLEPTLRAPLEQMLETAGPFARLFAGNAAAPGFLVGVVFDVDLPLALAVFAVLQAGRWAGEVEEGLLDLDLSTPLGRARLLISRLGAVLVAGAAAVLVAWLAALITGGVAGVPLAGGDLLAAALAALLVLLVYLGIGLAAAAWRRPSWAAPTAGALALVDFVYGIVSPALQLPSWTRGLSVFARYGNPAVEGIRWSDLGVLVLLGAALTGLALVGFQRRDLPG